MSTAGTGSAGFAVLCGMAAVYAVTIAVSLFVTIKALRVPDLPTVAAKVFPPPTAANPSIGYTGPSLPPLNDNALVWKERYTGGKSILLMPHTVLLLATPLSLAVWLGLTLVIDEVVAAHPQGLSEALGKLSEVLGPVLHGSYAVCLACYSIGVAFRAAASVVRERQMRTLDLLLQIPIERREILAAKGWGALARGWPWLALLVGNVAVGLAIGAYHPLSGLFLAMLPAPLALALCSAGLLISVYARTPQRANVFMGMVLLPLAGCCGLLGPALNRALVFRLWQGGVIERRDLMAAVSGAGLLLGFAVAFWLLAVPAFERTSRR